RGHPTADRGDLRELMSRGQARVGCSGRIYKDWRGAVYPAALAQREWFAHYASLFDTVELNNTFYRLPSVEAVDAWAKQAPPGFVYALKLGAFGSHRMKLRDAQSWLPNHIDRAGRLGTSLGPTVVQLPPRWRCNVERLDEFLSVAPRSMRWAVELRDPSWLREDVYAVLRPRRGTLRARFVPRPTLDVDDRMDLPTLPRPQRDGSEV